MKSITTSWFKSFALVAGAIFLVLLFLPWKPNTHLAPGDTREEKKTLSYVFPVQPKIDFTQPGAIAAAASAETQYYIITPERAAALTEAARVTGHGVEVADAKVTVEPATIEWSGSGKTKYSAPGARFRLSYRIAAPATIESRGQARLEFNFAELESILPQAAAARKNTPVSEHAPAAFRNLEMHPDGKSAMLGNIGDAVLIALAIAIPLHGLWLLISTKRLSKRIDEQSAPEEVTLPQTFEPNPTYGPLITSAMQLSLGFVGAVFAGISLLDPGSGVGMKVLPYAICGVLLIAWLCGSLARKGARGVTVTQEGVTLTKGMSGRKWAHLPWEEVESIEERSKTFKGTTTHWVVIQSKGKTYKLTKGLMQRYPQMRDLLLSIQAARETAAA